MARDPHDLLALLGLIAECSGQVSYLRIARIMDLKPTRVAILIVMYTIHLLP